MKRLIVICGATASGKSDLAVELARRRGGEVVSCDSMQLYRGMDIGTATPDEKDMRGVRHHLISVIDPNERVSAAAYRNMALSAIEDIVLRGRLPLLCGGTGLYINALTKPLGFSVEGDEAIRSRLTDISNEPGGREKLHEMLRDIDKESANRLHVNDLRRVIRAIEVCEITGKPLSWHMRNDREREGDFEGALYAIEWPRETLYERIDRRVDAMVAAGLLDEVKSLLGAADPRATAMQAIGYKELAGFLRGDESLESAVEAIKQNTRRYAKRQLTWFRNDERVVWLKADDPDKLADEIIIREDL
ncbi:MAG: tRNA (adenosine(37)-N6)-dimethylallyltransferase MiaA [Clostridia bacterium]|nr:tRNA (adenosine(37)-N6)-dimethylallyltransferase MiaA [Clostridia bacterium]